MDIKALRVPSHTANELAAAREGTRARVPRLVHQAAHPERAIEPVARSELWRKYFAGAIRDGHTEPERFADAAVRSREAALKKQNERAKVQIIKEPPKPPTAAAESTGRAKGAGPRCQAKTLEGRQCGFAATCGPFCKKHAPKDFQLVTDPRRFADVRLKGYINAKPSLVESVLGKPNGASDEKIEKEWKLIFSDGTPATVFYSRSDPALHICGEGPEVIARVRQLLTL